jgi:hypothetical protein
MDFDDFDTQEQIEEILPEDYEDRYDYRNPEPDEDIALEDRLYPWLADDSMADHNG